MSARSQTIISAEAKAIAKNFKITTDGGDTVDVAETGSVDANMTMDQAQLRMQLLTLEVLLNIRENQHNTP